MKQLTYAMQFKGQAVPVQGQAGRLRATTSAPSALLTTIVNQKGVEGEVEEIDGSRAHFTSEVAMTGEATFQESGTIRFGPNGHALRFVTLGEGHMGPSAEAGITHGSVIRRVEGGEGQFQGATGLITSNFTLSQEGVVTDNQFGVVYLRGLQNF